VRVPSILFHDESQSIAMRLMEAGLAVAGIGLVIIVILAEAYGIHGIMTLHHCF